jgi:GTPase SAR1 family protein
MFSLFAEFIGALTPEKRKHNVLVLGLDNAGKTSLLHAISTLQEKRNNGGALQVAVDETNMLQRTTTTLGLHVVRLEDDSTCVTVWDIGGSEAIRPMWRHYFGEADKLVYVIDSRQSIEEIERAIDVLLEACNCGGWLYKETGPQERAAFEGSDNTPRKHWDPMIGKQKPILVVANKMDTYGLPEKDCDVAGNLDGKVAFDLEEKRGAETLEMIAKTFTRKLDEMIDEGIKSETGINGSDCYSIKCLPASCTNAQYLMDVLDWLLM